MRLVIPEARAMTIIGSIPVRVTHGTSSSATFTTMRVITKENAQRVMSRIGKVRILSTVPRIRFTSQRITAKNSAAVYQPSINMPGTSPD